MRYRITDKISSAGAWRFVESEKMQPAANAVYFQAFKNIGSPLLDGVETKDIKKSDFDAGYDVKLGIDATLFCENGMQFSLQEKFLFTNFYTVTVEYMQDHRNGVNGDWFNMKCELYFVGYAVKGKPYFDKWVLLDWPRIKIATGKKLIHWEIRQNMHDGARASFMFVPFKKIPEECILDKII